MKLSSRARRSIRIIVISLALVFVLFVVFWFFDVVLNGMIVDWFDNTYMTTYEEYIPEIGRMGIIRQPNWDQLKQLLFLILAGI